MYTIFIRLWLSLALALGQLIAAYESDPLWAFYEPGDVVLHGLFPIRTHSDEGFTLNFEGVIWMGAMIQRIREINQEKSLPLNLTLGYDIRDTAGSIKIGLRQTLSVLHQILNKQGKQNEALQLPVVLGPATNELERTSEKLYQLFDVPRVAYTTTSDRKDRKVINTVLPHIVHVEALLRILNDMKAKEFCVVVSNSSLWHERVNMFEVVVNQRKNGMKLKNIVHMNTIKNDVDAVSQRITCNIVVIFAESNISHSLIRPGIMGSTSNQDRTWIEVCQFDDPLLRIFDTFGKLTKKIIIHNRRGKAVVTYRRNILDELLSMDADKIMKHNWLSAIFEKQCGKIKADPSHNESSFKIDKECTRFWKQIILTRGYDNESTRSSLTLQGVIDAVDLVVAALINTLKNCATPSPHYCPKLSGATLFKKMNEIFRTQEKQFASNYSLQVLRRVKDSASSEHRLKKTHGLTFKKIRDWLINGSKLRDELNLYWKNVSHSNNVISISPDNNQIKAMNSSSGHYENCKHCEGAVNQSHFDSVDDVISWTDTWAIVLYFFETLCLLAVMSTFIYFSQHKNSPIMTLCYSWPESVTLAVLCIFSLLPNMHLGHIAAQRCLALWPIVNLTFTCYTGLLLTKTLCVQNLLKCKVATDRPWRRMMFTFILGFIQVMILASLLLFKPPSSPCSPRGTVTLCCLEGNYPILFSVACNWILISALLASSVTETLKQRENVCRTENLAVVATVEWISYTCLTMLGYFNMRVQNYLVVVLIQCLIYLVNACVCLTLIYVPTLRLVATWLRQHTRQKKNLTSIKRAQVISSKHQTSGPIRDSLFNANISSDQLAIPSARHSGYYFDMRPSSAVTERSYPTSLVRSVHEQTHVVFGYGRKGGMSLNEGTSVESVSSMDWLDAPSQAHSASSSYDNIPQAAEETADELIPQGLLHEISTYWERHRTSNVTENEQNEENIETKKWPSLEKLRASDL